MDENKKNDDLGQPGEIREYDRTGGPDKVRGDELNPNKESDITPIYLTGDSTLQTAAESEKDDRVDPTKNDSIAVSNDDISQPIPPRMAGDSNLGIGDRPSDDDEGGNS